MRGRARPSPADMKERRKKKKQILSVVFRMSSGHFGFLLLVQLGNTAVDETSSTTVMMRMTAEMGRVMKML